MQAGFAPLDESVMSHENDDGGACLDMQQLICGGLDQSFEVDPEPTDSPRQQQELALRSVPKPLREFVASIPRVNFVRHAEHSKSMSSDKSSHRMIPLPGSSSVPYSFPSQSPPYAHHAVSSSRDALSKTLSRTLSTVIVPASCRSSPGLAGVKPDPVPKPIPVVHCSPVKSVESKLQSIPTVAPPPNSSRGLSPRSARSLTPLLRRMPSVVVTSENRSSSRCRPMKAFSYSCQPSLPIYSPRALSERRTSSFPTPCTLQIRSQTPLRTTQDTQPQPMSPTQAPKQQPLEWKWPSSTPSASRVRETSPTPCSSLSSPLGWGGISSGVYADATEQTVRLASPTPYSSYTYTPAAALSSENHYGSVVHGSPTFQSSCKWTSTVASTVENNSELLKGSPTFYSSCKWTPPVASTSDNHSESALHGCPTFYSCKWTPPVALTSDICPEPVVNGTPTFNSSCKWTTPVAFSSDNHSEPIANGVVNGTPTFNSSCKWTAPVAFSSDNHSEPIANGALAGMSDSSSARFITDALMHSFRGRHCLSSAPPPAKHPSVAMSSVASSPGLFLSHQPRSQQRASSRVRSLTPSLRAESPGKAERHKEVRALYAKLAARGGC